MKNKIKFAFGFVLLLLLLSASALACVCIRDKVKARGFVGRVVFAVSESRANDNEEGLQGVTIKLLQPDGDEEKIVYQIVTDTDGRFKIKDVKPGKYTLVAESLHAIVVATKIKTLKSSRRGRNDELDIGLSPIIECCAGYAKVRKSNKD